jgi:hypothetical protein
VLDAPEVPPLGRSRNPRLVMRATVDREEFFAFQHGDGRSKLIERLAAAYFLRAAAPGELSRPSPRPVPTIHGLQRRDRKCPLSSNFRASSTTINAASLRLREVLRRAAQHVDLQALFVRRDELGSGPDGTAEVLSGAASDNKNPRFPGISFLPKPSDGLEPSTPSLPWRCSTN